jgi:hypothetical protein
MRKKRKIQNATKISSVLLKKFYEQLKIRHRLYILPYITKIYMKRGLYQNFLQMIWKKIRAM